MFMRRKFGEVKKFSYIESKKRENKVKLKKEKLC